MFVTSEKHNPKTSAGLSDRVIANVWIPRSTDSQNSNQHQLDDINAFMAGKSKKLNNKILMKNVAHLDHD